MPPAALASSTASCMPLRPARPRLALGPETSTITPRRMGGGALACSSQAASSRAVQTTSSPCRLVLAGIVIRAIADNPRVGHASGPRPRSGAGRGGRHVRAGAAGCRGAGRRVPAAPSRLRCRDKAQQRCQFERLGKQVALAFVAAHLGQRGGLAFLLDAFGDQFQLQAAAQLYNGFHDAFAAIALFHLPDKAEVDLQTVDIQAFEVAERGETGAEIVHREAYAQPLDAVEQVDHKAGVEHGHRLGDFQLEQAWVYAAFLERML